MEEDRKKKKKKKQSNYIYLIFGVLLVVLIIAAVMYFFPQLNPFKSTSTSSPSSSSDKPEDQNEPPKEPKEEKKQEIPSEVIARTKAIKSIMLKINYLTDYDFNNYKDFTNSPVVDEETIRQLVNANFRGWNEFEMSPRNLVVFGCTLLKKYADESLPVETREKYVDIVTNLIAVIGKDFVNTNYDIKRSMFQNNKVFQAIEILGRLLNMYQYVVGSDKPNRDYSKTKFNCKEYLDKLVPKLNNANDKVQVGADIVFVTTPLLLSLYVMDYESYKSKIANEKNEFDDFKSALLLVKGEDNPRYLSDYNYYRDVIKEFDDWKK